MSIWNYLGCMAHFMVSGASTTSWQRCEYNKQGCSCYIYFKCDTITAKDERQAGICRITSVLRAQAMRQYYKNDKFNICSRGSSKGQFLIGPLRSMQSLVNNSV